MDIDTPYNKFINVEAKQQLEILDAFLVSIVPYFVFFKHGNFVDTLEGENPL